MSFENILVTGNNGVCIITINRPDKLNSLNRETITELSKALSKLEADSEVRAVIITGAGEKAFVAGADISEFAEFSKDQGKQLSQEGHDKLFNYIEKMSTPVIAAVNGFALGGGLELALCSHIRVFSKNARVGLPETSLGVIPGYGGTQRLAQIIGKGRAMQLILTAEIISAETAMEFGLTSMVLPIEKLLDSAKNLAMKIKKNSPNAVSKAIACINANYHSGVNGLNFEVKAFGDCFEHPEFKEGTQAFLEKRNAKF